MYLRIAGSWFSPALVPGLHDPVPEYDIQMSRAHRDTDPNEEKTYERTRLPIPTSASRPGSLHVALASGICCDERCERANEMLAEYFPSASETVLR